MSLLGAAFVELAKAVVTFAVEVGGGGKIANEPGGERVFAYGHEFGSLSEGDRAAAAGVVVEVLEQCGDRAGLVARSDSDALRLAAALRSEAGEILRRAALGLEAEEYFEHLLRVACVQVVAMVTSQVTVRNDVQGAVTGLVVQTGPVSGDLNVIYGGPGERPPVVRNRIPVEAGCFQQRAVFDELVEALAADTFQVVVGMGGVGKTQLAARYARHRLRAQDVDLVIWVDASSRNGIVSEYAEAGAEFAGADLGQPERAAERFLAWLATTGQRWLVVLDNVSSPGDLAGLRPPSENPAGRTVVTTRPRHASIAGLGRRPVEVDVFTQAEAEDYLGGALTGRLADDVAGVVADLGRLPLALGQAAAYMVDRGLTCGAYRRRFADRAQRLAGLVPAAGAAPDEYRKTVAATWSLSIEAADAEEPVGLARPVLELASLLASAGVPSSVFLSSAAATWLSHARGLNNGAPPVSLDVDAVQEALGHLRLFSLVSTDADVVGVHALVQRAVREELSSDYLGEVAWAAADALVDVWPEDGRDFELCKQLDANADALDRCAGEHLWIEDQYHEVRSVAGRSLGQTGRIAEACEHFARLHADAEKRLGCDNWATLAARGYLAIWHGELGDGSGLEIAERLVVDRRRVLGARHPDTLTARHTLADQLGRAGRMGEAIAELESLLAERVVILGADHPDTLATRHNLARWRGENGDMSGAVAEFEAVLAVTERVLGADHFDALRTRHELARWRSLSGDPARAAAEFAQLLVDRENLLGPDHPDTLNTRQELAAVAGRVDDSADTAGMFEALLADRLRVLGPSHPDTLNTRLHLLDSRSAARIDSTTVAEDVLDLIAELEELLGDVLSSLGAGHPYASQACFMLAGLRDKDSAPHVTVFEELLAACLRVLGPDHSETLAARTNVADLRMVSGDVRGAVTAYEELLAAQVRVLGPDDPDTLGVRNNIARLRGDQGDHRGAATAFEELLADCLRILGPDHPGVALVRQNLEHFRGGQESADE